MGDEGNKKGIDIIGMIPLKVKLGIIFGIIHFLIIIIVPVLIVAVILLPFSSVDNKAKKSGGGGSSGTSMVQISNAEATIVDKEGLSFMKDNSYFCYPITKMKGTTGKFGSTGKNWTTIHTGTDFVGVYGESQCVAVADGEVESVNGRGNAYGNHVVLKHRIKGKDNKETPEFYTMYCHMNSLTVKKGDKVKQGQVLGLMGTTGNVTGPHCHFEFSFNSGMYSLSRDPMFWVFEEHILTNYGVKPIKETEENIEKKEENVKQEEVKNE